MTNLLNENKKFTKGELKKELERMSYEDVYTLCEVINYYNKRNNYFLSREKNNCLEGYLYGYFEYGDRKEKEDFIDLLINEVDDENKINIIYLMTEAVEKNKYKDKFWACANLLFRYKIVKPKKTKPQLKGEVFKLVENNSFELSKPLIQLFGLDAAVFFCKLIGDLKYYKLKRMTRKTIEMTIANMKYYTGLTALRQNKAIKILEDYGLIKKNVRVKGLIKTRSFTINEDGVKKLSLDVKKITEEFKEHTVVAKEKYSEIIKTLSEKSESFKNSEKFNEWIEKQ